MESALSPATTLDRTLIDLITLAMLAKHAQWNLVGPTFRSMRLELGELADLARRSGDEVAERASTLGHQPDGRPETVAHDNALPTIPSGIMRDDVAVNAFGTILDVVVLHLHQAIDVVADDPVTRELLTAVAGSVEEKAWMIRSHGVPAGPGPLHGSTFEL